MSDAPSEAVAAAAVDPAAAVKAAEATLEAAVAEAAIAPVAKDYLAIVQTWSREILRNSPASADTATWNFLIATALPELVKRLQS
jgi:hypothetical protein